MIALVASAVGNWIVKVPEDTVLSAPNAITATASVVPVPVPVVVLYIIAPFAVKDAEEYDTSEKSVNAVVEDKDTPEFVNDAPPAV